MHRDSFLKLPIQAQDEEWSVVILALVWNSPEVKELLVGFINLKNSV